MELKYLNKEFTNHDEMYYFIMKEYAILIKNREDTTDIKKLLEDLGDFRKEKREIDLKNYWKTIDIKFVNTHDVPPLPRVDYYEEYVVPALIRCGAIPKNDLIDGQYYYGNYRNANIGKWIGNRFEIIRTKFGEKMKDHCNHFEDDDNFALFTPIRRATNKEIENNE